ncbi:MAG: cytochrome c [Ignavibacteriota bacterium]
MRKLYLIAWAVVLSGCGHRPERYIAPGDVTDFAALYRNNCAGVPWAGRPIGWRAPAQRLAVPGAHRHGSTPRGDRQSVPHTAMPPFAERNGGGLTDRQIAIIADEMEARWSRREELTGVVLPAYSAELGDAKRGETAFQEYCAHCHGASGMGGPKGGSVVDPAFLALTSDQSLRTTVIAGRLDHEAPDWRGNTPGRPMSAEEISDVVAWVSTHRMTVNTVAKGGMNQP